VLTRTEIHIPHLFNHNSNGLWTLLITIITGKITQLHSVSYGTTKAQSSLVVSETPQTIVPLDLSIILMPHKLHISQLHLVFGVTQPPSTVQSKPQTEPFQAHNVVFQLQLRSLKMAHQTIWQCHIISDKNSFQEHKTGAIIWTMLVWICQLHQLPLSFHISINIKQLGMMLLQDSISKTLQAMWWLLYNQCHKLHKMITQASVNSHWTPYHLHQAQQAHIKLVLITFQQIVVFQVKLQLLQIQVNNIKLESVIHSQAKKSQVDYVIYQILQETPHQICSIQITELELHIGKMEVYLINSPFLEALQMDGIIGCNQQPTPQMLQWDNVSSNWAFHHNQMLVQLQAY